MVKAPTARKTTKKATKTSKKRKEEELVEEDESLSDSENNGNNQQQQQHESGLLAECKKLFGTHNLYEVLCIEKTAALNEIKKAYHKLSLKVHPDKVDDASKDESKLKFQTLGKVYTILSDTEKRRLYDDTGVIDGEDSISLNGERDWDQYWRTLFRKVTKEDVIGFFKTYKGSSEEREDLKKLYVKHKGEMDLIMEEALSESVVEDEDRFVEILNDAISKGEVEKFRKFTHETKNKKAQRKAKWEKEAKEAEELKKELGFNENDDVAKIIQQKQATRAKMADKFLDDLAEKYTKKEKKTAKGGKPPAKKAKRAAAAAVSDDDDE